MEDIIDATKCGTEIASEAARIGEDPVALRDNGLTGDQRVVIYDLDGVLVADTNGGAVWQPSSPDEFAALNDQCK